MYAVTSWFIDQLNSTATSPKRVFKIGTSDYSARVVGWPPIKRSATELKPTNPALRLANQDGELNTFFDTAISLAQSGSNRPATLQIGFTHPTSGDELIDIYTGYLKKVSYNNQQLGITLKNNLEQLGVRKIGESNSPAIFSGELISDIAYTIITCYGGFTSADVHSSFDSWADVVSTDNIIASAQYEGIKCNEALKRLGIYTDTAIWLEGDNKFHFERFVTAGSDDVLFDNDVFTDLSVDLDNSLLVNRQWVFADYDITSQTWNINAFDETSGSVASYGLFEDVLSDENIWFTDSASALNMAQRKTTIYYEPQKRFELNTPMVGLHMQVADTIRMVDSFFAIDSSTALRITEYEFKMDNGTIKYELDGAFVLDPFYLDSDTLDGPKVLT